MKDIKKYLDEEREGKYSFFFKDLDGNYSYGYNYNEPMTSAGCMKLILAMVTMKNVSEGQFSMEELIPVKEEDKKPGSGILQDFIERTYTVRELISAMLTIGDNTATYKLMDLLTVEKINEQIQAMGLKNTTMSSEPGNEENKTTAEDLALAIALLYNKSYLPEKYSEHLIELLRRRVKSKIGFYLPRSVASQFASKTGDAQGIENEVALINADTGNFVFAIMSEDLPNSVYGQISIAKAGMMVWDAIHENWDTLNGK